MGGLRRNCCLIIIWIVLCGMLLSHPFVRASETDADDRDSLNSLLYDSALRNTLKPRTGTLYDVSLPSNLSGIEAAIVRLRTHRLWNDGVNFSSFGIPPMMLPQPFTRRVDIVYRNLGNRSRNYYSVPNHTFVAPVIGFLVYDSVKNGLVELNFTGKEDDGGRIIVRFRNILFQESVGMKCVKFDSNGTFGLSNVTEESSCFAKGEGHFSIVVPFDQPNKDGGKKRVIKWWIIVGILSGVVGLILFLVLGVFVYKLVKWKKVKEMEKMSERSEGLDTVWIGNSKMFSASGIRTPPILENTYVP